jgi:hypothetical protein
MEGKKKKMNFLEKGIGPVGVLLESRSLWSIVTLEAERKPLRWVHCSLGAPAKNFKKQVKD